MGGDPNPVVSMLAKSCLYHGSEKTSVFTGHVWYSGHFVLKQNYQNAHQKFYQASFLFRVNYSNISHSSLMA